MEKKKTNLWKEAGQLLLIMILNFCILFVATYLQGCNFVSEEKLEEIRKDAYDEGYRDAEFDNMDAANEAYKTESCVRTKLRGLSVLPSDHCVKW